MKRGYIFLSILIAVLALVLIVSLIQAGSLRQPRRAPQAAIGTGFTYQGQLMKDGLPIDGTCDVAFRLYDAASGGNQVGNAITATLPISNGLLTTNLDFGADAFTGEARWLELAVQCPGDSGFTAFGERQELTPAPYALYAETAGDADTLDGQHASDFVTRTLADARYARVSPTTQQIALLKWYTAISTTQSNFAVGVNPYRIAFDGMNMWTVNTGSSNISVLRASDGYRVMTITTSTSPVGIAFDGVNMWVASQNQDLVNVFRASDGILIATYTVGDRPNGIAFDGTNMWVGNVDSDNVSVLRASDGYHVMTPTVGNQPNFLAFDGVNMWVANDLSNNVSVLRASDGYHVMTPTVGSGPYGIAFDGTNMWVANTHSHNVTVLRASDGSHVATITVGQNPGGVAFDGANMWVVNGASNTISVLRVSDGALVKTVPTGNGPRAIAFDGANMWVVNWSSGTVSKR